MDTKNDYTPKRRFPGFEGEWEQKKLGDIVEINSGKDYKHLIEGDVPVYGTGGYMLSVSEALSFRDGIGIGRKGTIDKPYILRAPFWTVDTLFYCVPKEKDDLQFVNAIFERINWRSYDESTGVPSLSKVIINNIQVFSSCIDEQRTVGDFLLKVEKQISLHQHKLDKLKNLKKAYLSEMFPTEGQRVPKRRFPGFEGEWEEKKLGEIVEVNSGKDYKHLVDGEIPVFGTGGYMLSVSEALSFRDGIGIGRKGTIDKPFILKAPFWTVDTLFYCIPKDEYDLQFVNSLFNLVKWKEYDESTGVPSLSKVSINNIQVFSPSLDEQKIIGRFLMQLEKQISLQQQKLDKLNDLKKAYLNELFV